LINATRAKLPISPANLRQRVKQHDEMIDAIVSGDLERAATVATAHIRAAREDMLMQMRQVRTGTARAAAEASLTP
jgi:DNA-binding GntR family transcriptional regulator